MSLVSIPYNEDNGMECTYYERRASAMEVEDIGGGNHGNSGWQRPLVVLVPIDKPDNFNCLGGSYSCFGLDRRNNCI